MDCVLSFIYKYDSGNFDYTRLQKEFKKQIQSKKKKEKILSWLGDKIQEIYTSGYTGTPLSSGVLYRLLDNNYNGGMIL